jgi:hypothetical protein
MLATKTIIICGRKVEMLYCAATETGYEQLVSGTNKDINVFLPTILERDADGKPTKVEPPVAQTDDYMKLALAAIIAAAASKKQEPVISADDIMYHASSQEVTAMITTVVELRNAWYAIPEAVKPETDEKPEGDDPKNA